ncbi:MAG: hypothetical protein A2498_09625 [Lentisphaerae bacterium RIFOXYC12_FULL_60_16]|nr:MAG: hypothetical protein A2498_09625 [Lentisphaerae bacterium RIFOXYC12_FULL_60_16]
MFLFGIVLLFLIGAGLAYVRYQSTEKPTPITAPRIPVNDPLSPKTLDELLALSSDQLEKVDIARINLLCAVGLRGSEKLDVEQCIRTLDAWASNIDWQTKRNFHRFREQPSEYSNSIAYYRMGMMGTILVQDMQIQYNPKLEEKQHNESIPGRSIQQWNAFFSDSRDVFLHGLVTDRRYGTCASMPFLYVAVSRRLGYPVYVAARKYHLYARYEEDGKHLNIEATENQGFSTPTDEEYRDMGYLMTDEEIRECGWLRPLSNKEVLGVCLQIRASCLRSMKRYDDEVATLTQARRYVPDTPLMRRVIDKNKILSKNLQTEDHCYELWNEIENSQFPNCGPKYEYFRNRKLQMQFFAQYSTNATDVEAAMIDLLRELKEYRTKISDSPEQVIEAHSPPKPPANQQKFLDLLRNVNQVRRVRLPEESIPMEYRQGVPVALMNRLRRLTTERDIVTEMHLYAVEEMRIRDIESRAAMVNGLPTPSALSMQPSEVKIRPEDLPQPWRGRQIPPALQVRLASLNALNDREREMRTKQEIQNFFLDQDQRQNALKAIQMRRDLLDMEEPIMRPPMQIEVIISIAPKGNVPSQP